MMLALAAVAAHAMLVVVLAGTIGQRAGATTATAKQLVICTATGPQIVVSPTAHLGVDEVPSPTPWHAHCDVCTLAQSLAAPCSHGEVSRIAFAPGIQFPLAPHDVPPGGPDDEEPRNRGPPRST